MLRKFLVALLTLAVTLAVASKLEIFSWWTAGGEAEGLQELFNIYSRLYPGVEIINATVAGGAGAQARHVQGRSDRDRGSACHGARRRL